MGLKNLLLILVFLFQLGSFKDQCSPHIETNQVISSANQLTGLYMRGALVVKGLRLQKRRHNEVYDIIIPVPSKSSL